jgi:hypothetical protein
MATEQNYHGGDYRTWANVKGKPERKKYAATAMRYHVFPEDNLNYLAEPSKPFNFMWHSKKARFDDELDDLMDKGYVRVIVDGTNANFTNPVRDGGGERWRRGPEGTVISRLGELWAQPAEIGIALEEEERRRLNPKAKAEAMEDEIRGVEESIKRSGIDGIDVVGLKPKSKK